MPALDIKTADRLGKVLALLSSDHLGERAAAGARAHALLTGAGMTWPELVGAACVGPHREPLQATWRAACAALSQQAGSLRPWERGFVTDLPNFRRLSSKQRYILNEIVARVLGAGWQP